jgi:uncharacterized protein (UPF0335 family)
MNTALISAQLFDDWLARTWRELRRMVSLRAADPAEREARDAVDTLRERIARYEREQASYADDLRVVLARAEQDLARLARR